LTKGHTAQIASWAEAESFLNANPQIKYIDIIYTPLTDVPRGKRIRAHELKTVYNHGRYLPGSIAVVDTMGADCEDTGLVWEDGDADRLGKPAINTIFKAPWLGDDVAQCILSLYELDGKQNDLDPRYILPHVIDLFAAEGLTPDVACEFEFFLCAPREFGERPRLGKSPVTSHTPIGHEVYGLRELDDYMDFLRELNDAAETQGLPIEAAISEFSPGQLEIGLEHRADALRVADEAMMFKRLVKGVAVKHGFEATFMAKPFANLAGNGQHLHVSLLNEKGENVFASEDVTGSPLVKHAIAGMQAMMPSSMAIFAPNANSYRRFVGNSYAPIASTWGVNNRTVGLRITAGVPQSRHIEHRISGADASPYLGLAAMLAGVYHGIKNKLEPSEMVVGDGYSQMEKAPNQLPLNWFSAVDKFENCPLVGQYLGHRFQKMYSIIKHTEQSRFFSAISLEDYDWYFRNA
jgi:glutamine synthetase